MASSQVDVVASSPFSCVLREQSRRERCHDTNVRASQAAFEKNLKDLVRDHLHTCISISDQYSQNQNTSIDSWIANGQRNTNCRIPHNQNCRSQRDVHVESSSSQAREIPSTIEKKAQEVEILASANSPTTSTSSHSNASEKDSPTQTENALARASSLVQIWEARLNRTGPGSIPNGQNQCQTSRTSPGLSSAENFSPVDEPPSRNSELCEHGDERSESRTNNEDKDNLTDWESHFDRIALSEAPSFSNGEKERVRVADIIKRLGNNVGDSSPTRERKHILNPEQTEQKGFSQVSSSPRVRGRQALHELLVLMERERHKELDSLVERQLVSKFPQRGRIQSMLRLRCLQRGLATPHSTGAEENRNHPKSGGAEVSRSPPGSNIMQLREKFSTSLERVMTVPSHMASARIHRKETANRTQHSDTPSTSTPPSEDRHRSTLLGKPPLPPSAEHNHPTRHRTISPKDHLVSPLNERSHLQELSSIEHQTTLSEMHSLKNKIECVVEKRKPHSDVVCQTTCLEATNLAPQKTTEASTSLNGQEENQMVKEPDALSQQHLEIASQATGETETIASTNFAIENIEMADEEDVENQQHSYLDSQEIVETAISYDDWDENDMVEEEDTDYQQYFEGENYDWFSYIAKPRSYWEKLRQAWYQEVFNTTSEDEEIRQLLERRRVSTCLASDFRNKMDQVMKSRIEMQVSEGESQEDEPNEEERMLQLMSFFTRQLHGAGSQEGEGEEGGEVEEEENKHEEDDEDGEEEEEEEEDEEEEEEDDEEEEGGSTSSHQSHEATEYYDQSSPSIQMPSPSLLLSWNYQDDNETGDDSNRIPSRSSPVHPPSQAQSFQGSQQSSSNRHSLEMELICDLRGRMEQLYREMAELRKSVISCMDMQMKMQQFFNQEIHSVQGQVKNQPDGALLFKRTCCICYEMQVDSLLYRCGHMCTCLKCAHELQWSSGKCPICRAPIVDVVQVYVDS
ncbi:hypothetical protein SLEP1_g34126 [Rubroshorea leprosula]|uniref:RING-type domain-containing protein n=1 Tax=Rubroshorea leprosula TaxID=152421 RepID=A0AAV5KIW4_9ROSI|nr:hypothetical protein SLEP1_g34126 [Rubroshorea leprosula]